jgi:WD40 repeat protein
MLTSFPQHSVPQALLLTALLPFGAALCPGEDRLPVPDGDAQAEAAKLVRELFEQEYKSANTPAGQTALAKKLLEQAAQNRDDATACFVILRVARDMAVQAGDARTALEAVDRIAGSYEVNASAMKVEILLSTAANAHSPDVRKSVAEAAIPLIRAAIAEDDFESATRLVRKALDLARRSRDTALVKRMVAINQEVAEAGKEYAALQQARAKLEEQPTDPDANLAVGRYLCVLKGDWEKGVPMLALGSDPALKALAIRELEEADSPSPHVALADAWWDLAQGKTGPEKESFLLRAGYWYQEAEARLTSELATMKVRKRLEEIDKLGRRVADTPSSRPRSSRRSSRRAAIESWDVESVQHVGTLRGATNFTYALAFSPDGKTLASANVDTTAKLWNVATGQCLRTFKAHPERNTYVFSVAFSPNGSTLAWAGANTTTVKVLNLTTGELRQTRPARMGDVWTVAFSPDSSTVASGSDDAMIRLWDVSSGELRLTLEGHRDSVRSVAFVPNGATLVSGSEDKTIKLWDTASGKLRRTLTGHASTVFSVAVSPDGSMLASGGKDKTVKLWRLATGEVLHTLEGHTAHVRSVAFHPDGSLLASGCLDTTVKLWDVATGEMKRSLRAPARNEIFAIAFSPNGSVLASGASADFPVLLWGPAPGRRR